jgi:tetratricopeptide (TPR) repeat protein
MQRALALRELGDYRTAAELFRRAIDRLAAQYRRDRGQNLARLALTLARAGEREEAAALAAEARTLATETGSARTRAEPDRVAEVLGDAA